MAVKLRVAAVLYETQAPGTLLVHEAYVLWTPTEASDGEPLRFETAEITGWQKAKRKPLLRVVTARKPFIFEFEDEPTRDSVEKTLQPFVSKTDPSQHTTHSSDQQALKRQLLDKDSDLKTVYDGLVERGVLTDQEFWRPRMHLLDPSGHSAQTRQQTVGLDSALMPEVLLSTEGSETLMLSPALIQQIFAERPHIKRAFERHVPADMDENEFWQKYRKHQDAVKKKRRKMMEGDLEGTQEIDDEFADLFEMHGDEGGTEVVAEEMDTALDLRMDDTALGPGYGRWDHLAPPTEMEIPRRGLDAFDLADEVNQHGAVVLQGTHSQSAPNAPFKAATAGLLEGLTEQAPAEFETLNIQTSSHDVPISVPPKKRRTASITLAGISTTPNLTVEALEALAPSSLKVLEELHYGGEMRDEDMSGVTRGVSPADGLSKELLDDIRRQVLCLNEILRRFWSSYPVNTHTKEVSKNLTRLAYSMKKTRSRATSPRESSLIQQLLKPIQSQVDAAVDKHTTELESRQRHLSHIQNPSQSNF